MTSASPSTHDGMGAMPYKEGTSFRVWAPHADRVSVIGSFNNWSKTANSMTHEGNGYWSCDIPEAKAGDEYRYLIVNGSKELSRIDPYAREVTSSVGNTIISDPHFKWGEAAFQTPALNEMVIYEMHIGTFNDQPGGPPGNLNTAIEKLPYLEELGINAIEVMPPMEFAGGFSWGYNPAFIFAIESDYGGPRAFKEFVKAAHDHGIAVIFDVVYNHFGPSDLGIWQFDGWSENDKGGIYFYNDWRSQTPWGETRPDYGIEEVRHYIHDNAIMWLEEYGVDGLRWDMTAFIRNVHGNDNDPEHNIPEGWSLMQWINNEIKAWHGKISIAEDMKDNPFLTKETGEGGAGFDAQWDPGFVHPIREAIILPDDKARNMDAVRDAIAHRYDKEPFKSVIYTESHDEVANGKARVPEEISPGDAGNWAAKKLSTLGASLVFTSPGIPMIFQGQEFFEDDWFHDQDPIDWTKKDTYSGILQLYRDLIRLRRNRDGTTGGLAGHHTNVYHVNDKEKVMAFHRWNNGGGPRDDIIVVVNMANHAFEGYKIGFPRAGKWEVRFNSDWSGYDPTFSNHLVKNVEAKRGKKDGMPFSGIMGVGPYSAVILSQEG